MKIAIKRLMGLGDVIVSEPLISHLKKLDPECKISYITSDSRSCNLVTHYMDGVDNSYAIKTHSDGESIKPYIPVVDQTIDLDQVIHMPGKTYFQSYVEHAGIDYATVERKHPRLTYCLPREIKKDYVVLVSEASGWRGKEWPLHYYAKLAKMLVGDGITVVEPGAHRFVFQSEYQNVEADFDKALNWIKHARMFIGGDCGLMHVALAFNVPCVICVGSVCPKITTEAYKLGLVTEASKNLFCTGCVHSHFLSLSQPECINREVFSCMTKLTVDEMYRAVWSRLEKIQ